MSTTLHTLCDGLLDEVKDLYSAEHQLVKALPKMEKKASNQKLKEAFRNHLQETEGQLRRLDEIGKLLEQKLSGKTCKAMQGLVEEGAELISQDSDNKPLLDALLIGAAQRVEHYEIAAYGTAHAMAIELGQEEIASLLAESLEEEMNADKTLSSISEGGVLSQANAEMDIERDEQDLKPSAHEKGHRQKKGGNSARMLILAGCIGLAYDFISSASADTAREHVKNEAQARTYHRDNTGRNVRDRSDTRVTADDQKLNGPDLETLARIRREIVGNENLSTNAHNVKIIVGNGKVILRGPVKSAEEKAWISKATSRTAAGYSVEDQLEVSAS